MSDLDRLNLQKMISANDVKDTTVDIRIKKHSLPIKQDVQRILILKKIHNNTYRNNFRDFESLCIQDCQFLFNNYTDIFNKILKDEIDLNLFGRFLEILKRIEESEIDQHEGSFQVGSILKQIYIDSALKRADSLNKTDDGILENKKIEPKNVSWKEWKKIS
jgi:hypothetical protein